MINADLIKDILATLMYDPFAELFLSFLINWL